MASHASLLVSFLQRKLREEKWNFVSESTLEFKEEVIVVFVTFCQEKSLHIVLRATDDRRMLHFLPLTGEISI